MFCMLFVLVLLFVSSKSPHPPVGTFSHAKAHGRRRIAFAFSRWFLPRGEGGQRPDEGALAWRKFFDNNIQSVKLRFTERSCSYILSRSRDVA